MGEKENQTKICYTAHDFFQPLNPRGENTLDPQTQTEIEAAAFRRLVKHLQERTDVQNIDLMILADFCRNCLSKWMVTAAEERDAALNYDEAREYVYGMPYSEWKQAYQTEASPEKMEAFQNRKRQKET